MPAKSKHMERRKQRIANAKKNARLAGKIRRRRRLQALFGLVAIAAVLALGYLWQTGFFEDPEPPAEEAPSEQIPATDPAPSEEEDGDADQDADEEADGDSEEGADEESSDETTE